MADFDPEAHSHRRFNPLTGQWVLVSPHRTKRPWQGQTEPPSQQRRPPYDETCYLCPGNRRAGSDVNPSYQGTFVFDNDFSALSPPDPDADPAAGDLVSGLGAAGASASDDPLFKTEPVQGACRVICFSPRHDLTLAEMEVDDIARVVDTWAAETTALGARYPWVQVFENKGAVMGCSNPHPHGQIWAQSALPNDATAEDGQQRAYHDAHGTALLHDAATRELDLGLRVVHHSRYFVAVVPFWAVWPFETLILPRHHVLRLPDLTAPARTDLAEFLHALLGGYDRLFDVSFPYSMGWHGAPFERGANHRGDGASAHDHWQLHAHIFPPLLRSASIKKYMVGYELLAEPQRDLTPEQAAQRLRDLVR